MSENLTSLVVACGVCHVPLAQLTEPLKRSERPLVFCSPCSEFWVAVTKAEYDKFADELRSLRAEIDGLKSGKYNRAITLTEEDFGSYGE